MGISRYGDDVEGEGGRVKRSVSRRSGEGEELQGYTGASKRKK